MSKKNYMHKAFATPCFYLSAITLVGCSKTASKLSLENTNHHRDTSIVLLNNGQEDPWVVIEPNKHDMLRIIQYARIAASHAKIAAENMEVYASEIDTDAACAQATMARMRCAGKTCPSRLRTILGKTAVDLKTVSDVVATIMKQFQQIAEIKQKEAQKIKRATSMLTSKVTPIQSTVSLENVAANIETIQAETQSDIADIDTDVNVALSHYATGAKAMINRVIDYVDEIAGMKHIATNQIDEVTTYLRKLLRHVSWVNYTLQIKPDQATSNTSVAVQHVASGQTSATGITIPEINGNVHLDKVKEILGKCGSGLSQGTAQGMTIIGNGLTYAVEKGAEGIRYAAPIAASAAKYAAAQGVKGIKYAAPIAASATKYAAAQGVKGVKYAAPIAASVAKYAAVQGVKGVKYAAPIAASAAKYAAVQGVKGVKYAAPIAASAAKYAAIQGVKGVEYLYQHAHDPASTSYAQEALNRENRNLLEASRRILGLTGDSNQAAIRRAYYREALKWHPDRNNDPTAAIKFHAIRTAYNLLQV